MSEMRLDLTRHPAPVPTLLVELPSWPRTFLANLRETVAPRRLPPLDISPPPPAFWPDVFGQRSLAWSGFAKSSLTHIAGLGLLIGLTRLFARQPNGELVTAV